MPNKIDIYKMLCEGIKEVKGADYTEDEIVKKTFWDLGVDSLEFIKLVVFLETKSGLTVGDELLAFADRSVEEFTANLVANN
ncbi:phosphopantetheine-binding protein [Butyrivibrio sp. NC3005]|uniref:phosphopantetheine-binding protein n=1 Tax=Butyrivibrio sp. NC3005 TaxID=1280685 RepID=UPI000416F316|nr:phosphopantetheine-binding protein [Butyrivibrio sp. NC3005]